MFAVAVLHLSLWCGVVADDGDDPAKLLAEGREQAALAACAARLSLRPAPAAADPALVVVAAQALHRLGRHEEALARLAGLQAGAPDSVDAQLLAARCLVARGEPLDVATKAVETLPLPADDPRRAPLRVRLLLARGRVGDALREAGHLAARAKDDGEARFLHASALVAAGRPVEAEEALARLESREPPADLRWRRDGWQLAAEQKLRVRRWAEAAVLYGRVAAASDAATPCAQQAMALGFARQYGAALAAWEEAVRRAPDVREHRLRLADLLRSQGRPADAAVHFRLLADAEPPLPLAVLRLAELEFEAGRIESAAREAERAAALLPDSGDVAAIRARIAEKQGDRPRAITLHRAALAASPLRFDSLYRVALLLARSKDAAEAAEGEALLVRYRRIEPWLQEIDLARQEANSDPRQPLLLARIGALLNAAGEFATAKGFLLRAERLAPPQAATLVQSAYVHANLGETAAAADRFARALPLVEAGGDLEAAKKLRDWIAQVERGEALPLPMGEIVTAGVSRDE
jgi:tetratricopeptide (TPR) repeat protein